MIGGATLIVLACAFNADRGDYTRDCVAWMEHVASVAECQERYAEIKLTLPANIRLGFPECVRARR